MNQTRVMDSGSYQVSFEGYYRFEASPEELWEALGRSDLYTRWFRWMRDVEVAGSVPERGSSVSFKVFAPIPYRIRLRVEVVSAVRPKRVHASVEGDLRGRASLALETEGTGSVVRVKWDVVVVGRALRPAMRVARPLLLRAQHWAVDVALRGFRRHLSEVSR